MSHELNLFSFDFGMFYISNKDSLLFNRYSNDYHSLLFSHFDSPHVNIMLVCSYHGPLGLLGLCILRQNAPSAHVNTFR